MSATAETGYEPQSGKSSSNADLEHLADQIEELARDGCQNKFTHDERQRLMACAWNIKLVARGGKSV